MHNETKQRVAIKIMDKREIRDQDFTSQVRREIYIMRSLVHKHIVRLHEVLTSDTRLYIVMELVTGGELFDRIEHGRIPEDLARKYFQQLVDGVDFCHKRGVAHRDLKPENLLIDDNGDIKITDFGFSSMKGRDVNAGLLYTQCGTPDYCAPEIIDSAKEGYNGAKVDAWSSGIILYALLAGRLPFQEQDTEKLYDLILACKVHYPPQISPEARDLLEHLLVRDPSKRFDFQKVKRHPWFLLNYEGDDAKLVKKRPFFIKAQKEASGSNPSSPVTTEVDPLPAIVPSPSPLAADSAFLQTPANSSFDQPSDTQPISSSLRVPVTATETSKEAGYLQQQHFPDQQQDFISRNTGRPMPFMQKSREEHHGALCKPTSPANEIDAHIRAATPPTHAIFTRVEDRPATPAKRRTSEKTAAAFKAAQAAAEKHANPLPANGPLPLPIPSISPGFGAQSQQRNGLSPNGTTSLAQDLTSEPKQSREGGQYDVGVSHFSNNLDSSRHGHDDSSSEQDSIEDYEEKPAPRLELPTEHFDRLRLTTQGRSQQIQSLSRQRHRSDLGYPAASDGPRLGSPDAVDNGSASMSSVQLQWRMFTREGAGNALDIRPLRMQLSSEVPSSPPVVYSPGGYDRYRPVSPGFTANGGQISDSSPNGSVQPGTPGLPSPWQMNGNGYSSSRDDGASSGGSSIQADTVARRLWNMVCRLRGTDKPADRKLSEDLRADLRLISQEMNQMTRYEDIANVFTNFLSLFETLGLSDGPASSPNFRNQNRSRGTSDVDEEYEDVGTIGSRDEYSTNGDIRSSATRRMGTDMSLDDVRYAVARRTVTDMSSEEEPISWSPVLAESSRHQSDLARHRNISDLLNRMIKRTHRPFENERGERPAFGVDEDEPTSTADMMELQRLIREHHGGRDNSNRVADDLLKIMNSDNDNSNSASFGIGLGPSGQMTRSGDSFGQARYQGSAGGNMLSGNRPNTPLRNASGSNVPLPPEYRPGRFHEASSISGRSNSNRQEQNVFGGSKNDGEGNDIAVSTLGSQDRSDMANSMGMHNVAYYGSDKKNGVANKFRYVLQTMKVKNQRLGERHAQFRSALPPDVIMRLLGRILMDMRAEVSIKKETKRKMKCKIALSSNSVLVAGIELTSVEEGMTLVAFRRSRQDKGRTDTESFHSFFEKVRKKFIEEAKVSYPCGRGAPTGHCRRRNGHGVMTMRQISDSTGYLSVS